MTEITLMDMLKPCWAFVKLRNSYCYHAIINPNVPAKGWLQLTNVMQRIFIHESNGLFPVWRECSKVIIHESMLERIEGETGEPLWLR